MTKSTHILTEVKQDFKISWQLLKSNWRAFVATEIFALISLMIMLIGSIIIFGLFFLINRSSPPPLLNASRSRFNLNFIIVVIIILIFYAFLTSQFGLAYEIISSGDQFTEFKSSFTYFRRHGVYYTFFTFLIGWVQFLFEPRSILPLLRISSLIPILRGTGGNGTLPLDPPSFDIILFFIRNVTVFVIYFVFFIIFINTLASVTAQGRFKTSLKENFRILHKAPRQILVTWAIYFIIFLFPPLLVNLLSVFAYITITGSIPAILLNLLSTISFLVGIIVGAPMMALIATRMYNRIEKDVQPNITQQESRDP